MSTAIMEAELRDALNADRTLAATGCHVEERRPSGIAIMRGSSTVGVWHWRGGAFELEASLPASTDTVAAAVRYTRDRLCRAP